VTSKDVRPTAAEAWLETKFPGYRFGTVLVLISLTFIVMVASPPQAWSRIVIVSLQALTLLAALLASRAGRRLFRIAAVVAVFAVVAAVGSVIFDTGATSTGAFFILNVLLVATAPVAIARALWRRRTVDLRTVLGAVCIYVLLGMMFAFAYGAINQFGSEPFFAQTSHATTSDFLYFSYITWTTVGYGDFTARSDIGRAIAVVEALSGQLYLVTIVAVLVSRLAGSSTPIGPSPDREESDA